MTNQILKNSLNQEIQLNPIKKRPLWYEDPRNIYFDNSENVRTEELDLESLENFIQENGVEKLDALNVYRLTDKEKKELNTNCEFKLWHGYRRINAITNLINKGIEIARTPIIVSDKPTVKEELFYHIAKNNGKNLTSFERGKTFLKLESFGLTRKEIALKTGFKEVTICNDIQTFQLLENDKELKDLTTDNVISYTEVLQTFKSNDKDIEKTKKVINKALDNKIEKISKDDNKNKDTSKIKISKKDIEKVQQEESKKEETKEEKLSFHTIRQMLFNKMDEIKDILDLFEKNGHSLQYDSNFITNNLKDNLLEHLE